MNNYPGVTMAETTPLILNALTDPALRSPEVLTTLAVEKSFENTPWL